ncbi:glycine zipper 2TM domain-containing protein [Qipengyuania zhejiangensis]|uniref:glycine zipper 2TM domain-containing protein n=1 Tax=Qipengyuania zhejiangensis TaxID=3077782 RepID=UPI002D7A2E90|nr:glycine zipper 2TM domain-containing protein [Qipengyuania sp. Z2]
MRHSIALAMAACLTTTACAGPPMWAPAHGYRDSPYGYYADDHYRDGRHYRDRKLTRRDWIHRGRDGRYYCRRSDGTTGLIVGGALGALIGRELDYGESRIVGTLIGATAGALLGREIDRGTLYCT